MQHQFKRNACTLMLMLATGCSTQQAKPPANTPQPVPVVAAEPATVQTKLVIEPEAINALKRMGNYLHTLKTFSVSSQTSVDKELESGQKIMVDGELTVTAQLPNRLHIDRKVFDDDIDQQFFYDGKTFTIYGNKNKFYASIPAPSTIRELLAVAWERYDIKMPLSDLFIWGGDNHDDEANILAASYIGTSLVNGVSCDHYAFHNADVDWQLWIEKSETPLPRKLVITTTEEHKSPQYISIMDWNLSPKTNNELFTFVPHKDAHKIEFMVVEKSTGNGK
jgi:hypothetical protein